MVQKKYSFHTMDELATIIAEINGSKSYENASGVLMQLYNPKIDADDEAIVDYINANCSNACLVGLTCANIADIEYDIKDKPIELNVTFFKKTIDHFKHVNDTYGHDVGDMVLRASVDIVKDNLKPSHVFGRWGGEEFLYVLPETDMDKALEFAESLRSQIEQSYFTTVQHITMSFGVTQYKAGDTIDSFVKRADEGLYKAKESGRNRVVGN